MRAQRMLLRTPGTSMANMARRAISARRAKSRTSSTLSKNSPSSRSASARTQVTQNTAVIAIASLIILRGLLRARRKDPDPLAAACAFRRRRVVRQSRSRRKWGFLSEERVERPDEGKGAVGRDKQQSLEDRKASPLPFRRFVLHDRPSEKMGNNPFYFHHSIIMKCLGMCCVIVSGKS